MRKRLSLLAVLTYLLCAFCLVLAGWMTPANAAADLIPKMTSNTTPSGVASASSVHPEANAYAAYKAFNDHESGVPGNGGWVSALGVPQWLAYEFPEDTIVNSYSLKPYYYDTVHYLPGDWTFEGWNGVDWTILDQRQGISGWQAATKKEFSFDNNTAYKKYRINVTDNSSQPDSYGINRGIAISEMEMMYTGPTSITPITLTATPGNTQVSLTWNEVPDATSYNVKRATTEGGPYTTVATDLAVNTYLDTNVTNGTIYYYVVTAVIDSDESANSNEVSATPQASTSDGDAILIVTMNYGSDLYYDLSMNQIQSFIDWYKTKAAGGSGDPFYILSNDPVSPYISRTDYLVFDKIVCFKVNKYQLLS